MTVFGKLPLNNTQLYEKLIERQLDVPTEDIGAVYEALVKLGYYRFTGFCLPFLQTTADNRKVFQAGTTIRKILALYQFDTALRSLANLALEKIEIALATSICNTLCMKHGALWYAELTIFADPATHAKIFSKALDHMKFDPQTNRGSPSNPNEYLRHYYRKYHYPRLPPAWMLRECASFGFWSHTYSGLKQPEKSLITTAWKYPTKKQIAPVVFESWLHTATVFRNRCAHHRRITHTTLPYDPKTPDNVPTAARFPQPDAMGNPNTTDLRTFFLVIEILLRNVAPDFDWKKEVKDQFEQSEAEGVAVGRATGFRVEWRDDVFWSDWAPPPKAA